SLLIHVFFFQAEDGIRDGHVTGVQTCALPISAQTETRRRRHRFAGARDPAGDAFAESQFEPRGTQRKAVRDSDFKEARGRVEKRSEERRVGKEWRYGWWRYE